MKISKQTYYIFDSTGVIEKHNNIYYNPRNVATAQAWFDAFVSATNTSTTGNKYYGVDISKWSPQDRVLRVKGDIDDFRDYITSALILNYLIVKREVIENEQVVATAFVGFFIDSVSQVGQGEVVELSLSPDHFTNTFFFNVQGSDPFNETIKNAYVERQHYDRGKPVTEASYESYSASSITDIADGREYRFSIPHFLQSGINFLNATSGAKIVFKKYDKTTNELLNTYEGNKLVSFRVPDFEQNIIYGVVLMADDLSVVNFKLNEESQYNYVISLVGDSPLYFVTQNPDYLNTFIGNINAVLTTISYFQHLNEEVFATNKETFDYKYQYKDLRKGLNIVKNIMSYFTDTELSLIDSASSLDDLSIDLLNKIFDYCTYWYFIECRESIPMPYVAKYNLDQFPIERQVGKITKRNFSGSNICRIVVPTLILPDFLMKFESEVKVIQVYNVVIGYDSSGNVVTTTNTLNNPSLVNSFKPYENNAINLLTTYYSSYIQSIYVLHNLNVGRLIASYQFYTNHSLSLSSGIQYKRVDTIESFNANDIQENLIPCFIIDLPEWIEKQMSDNYTGSTFPFPSITYSSNNIIVDKPTISSVDVPYDVYTGIYLINNYDILKTSLSLNESVPDMKNNYYDPILTYEPYSFYSISTNESLELPLNKTRYYQSYNKGNYLINFDYAVSINGYLKSGLVVNYNLNNFEQRYYTDSLINTYTSTLPFSVNSYFDFMYRNMAQMRTQYAVTMRNDIIDFGQNILKAGGQLTGGISNIAMGMAGNPYALASGITSVAETGLIPVNNAIDIAQDLHTLRDTQNAQKAGAGAKPDSIKQAGSDLLFDIYYDELIYYLNHYTLDDLSKNNICKYLERYGYQVNRFDTLNVDNRVGWNYIKLVGCDFVKPMSIEQDEAIRSILKAGVTLLHDKSILDDETKHNYEVVLEE